MFAEFPEWGNEGYAHIAIGYTRATLLPTEFAFLLCF
jgi:hypothetical protein